MNQVKTQFGWLLAALYLVMLTGGTALADDTELFIAGEDNSAVNPDSRPNILFILDNSGSMAATVTTQIPWDPNQTFAGCYGSDRVYYSFVGQNPDCSSNNWFPKSVNRCEASWGALAALGEYRGNLLAWRARNNARQSRWVQLARNARNRDVECQDDAGVHGQTSGNFYAADGQAGPWSNSANNQPAWVYTYNLFDGNFLNWVASGGTVTRTRLEIVQEVTSQLLENLTNVNVGLMRFNFEEGGPVVHAIENIETARSGMQAAVNALTASNWTPLGETLYEAGQYYAGRAVDYGHSNFGTPTSVAASRVGGTLSSGTYQSPIEFACQKNYIILLTDGEPTRDLGANNRVPNLPGFAAATGAPTCSRMPGVNNDHGRCLEETAAYLYNRDLSTDLYGPQNVSTFTIGFAIDLPLLEETARRGGGQYFTAEDTGSLTSALTKITVSILDQASSFTAPSVPVNAFNRTQNLDDIFVSVFNPSSTVHWPGNVKKYKLQNGQLVDANGELAVSPETGFFKTSARSFWSTATDGDRPASGGAAEQLPYYINRKLYTNIAGGNLTSVANAITVDNNAITGAMLGGSGDPTVGPDGMNERQRMIQWMRGLDVFDADDDGSTTDTRRQIGDPLHVRPVPVIYGGTAEAPEMVIYISTNDGYFHAIDPTDGSELWAFVPERLFNRTSQFYFDETSATRVYGLDGEITTTIINDDKIGGISGSERVILSFGMRRGGDAVFALDVTDRNTPQLLWEIDSSTPGFEALGQTWSTPQSARVRVGSAIRDVLIFGAGYDAGQDQEVYRTDNMGNAVYMVDTLTGEKLWSAGPDNSHNLVLPQMTHSIPAPLRVADINGDGLASRLYFGDMGGRVWRIDIMNGREAAELGQGGVLASLGGAALGSPTAADIRRFYNQADIVSTVYGGQRFMAVNIGSGYRAHPLDRDIDEMFFSIRDYQPVSARTTESYVTPAVLNDFVDITAESGINVAADAAGWRLDMDAAPGEKVLSRSVTFNGTIFFSSFAPGTAATACTAVAGQNRLYAISLFNGDTRFDHEERYIDLRQGGIAPQVELLYVPEYDEETGRETGKLSGLVGTENVDLDFMDPINRTYWTQVGAQ